MPKRRKTSISSARVAPPRRKPIPRKWLRIIQQIPGYDPVATAAPGEWFDPKAAQLALDFFPECLTHIKGALAGQPFELEPWQAAPIANMFGWKRADGTRRYRTVLILIARKNGKTTTAAGIVNYVLFCDNEPGAEIYSAAADREQAHLVFEPAAGMVRNDDMLRARAIIYTKSIVLKDYSAAYRTISADAHTKHGYNTHCAVIDELHAQPNRDLVDVLTTSTGSRRQPLIIYITTSDFDRESICNETCDYAAKVRDGIIPDSSFLPVIYEASLDDDWTKRKTWAKANPNLGVSVSTEYIKAQCQKAQEIPAYENTFKRLHLNIRTEQAVRWLPLEKGWDRCADPVDPEALKGEPCFAGLDMASTTDVAALVLYFPSAGHAVLPFFWIPEEGAHARERRDRVPYVTWAREGHINLTEGNVIDYDRIRARINELGEIYHIREIAIDRWNSTQLQTQLAGDGFEIVPFGQGFASMSSPSKELEKLILSNSLRHGGNPVLRWMASNVAVETDAAANIKPSKKRSTEKIDGIVALVMAIGRAQVDQGDDSASVYAERGLLHV